MSEAPSVVPSQLLELRGRLQRFPQRLEAAKRIDSLKLAVQLVAGLREEFDRIKEQRNYLARVFPEAELSTSARQCQIVQVKASSILEAIGESQAATSIDPQQQLIELRRAIQSAASAIKSEWLEQIGTVAIKHERLSRALQRAGVSGSTEVLEAIERVRAMSNAPTSAIEASRAKKDIDSVGPILARLGLQEGLGSAIGEFLVAAGEGKGMAKSLLDPKVRAFLDQHGLWTVLRVSFG